MNKIIVAMFLLLVAEVVCGSQQHSSQWIKYSSPEGRYSVLLPGEPKLSSQEASTADGAKFTQYMASSPDANTVCLIGYFDHVGNRVFNFDKSRDGFIGAVKGTLLTESVISLGGYPGREMKVTAKSADGAEYVLRVRTYDVGSRVYVVQFIFLSSEDTPAVAENARKYFDSFALTKER